MGRHPLRRGYGGDHPKAPGASRLPPPQPGAGHRCKSEQPPKPCKRYVDRDSGAAGSSKCRDQYGRTQHNRGKYWDPDGGAKQKEAGEPEPVVGEPAPAAQTGFPAQDRPLAGQSSLLHAQDPSASVAQDVFPATPNVSLPPAQPAFATVQAPPAFPGNGMQPEMPFQSFQSLQTSEAPAVSGIPAPAWNPLATMPFIDPLLGMLSLLNGIGPFGGGEQLFGPQPAWDATQLFSVFPAQFLTQGLGAPIEQPQIHDGDSHMQMQMGQPQMPVPVPDDDTQMPMPMPETTPRTKAAELRKQLMDGQQFKQNLKAAGNETVVLLDSAPMLPIIAAATVAAPSAECPVGNSPPRLQRNGEAPGSNNGDLSGSKKPAPIDLGAIISIISDCQRQAEKNDRSAIPNSSNSSSDIEVVTDSSSAPSSSPSELAGAVSPPPASSKQPAVLPAEPVQVPTPVAYRILAKRMAKVSSTDATEDAHAASHSPPQPKFANVNGTADRKYYENKKWVNPRKTKPRWEPQERFTVARNYKPCYKGGGKAPAYQEGEETQPGKAWRAPRDKFTAPVDHVPEATQKRKRREEDEGRLPEVRRRVEERINYDKLMQDRHWDGAQMLWEQECALDLMILNGEIGE